MTETASGIHKTKHNLMPGLGGLGDNNSVCTSVRASSFNVIVLNVKYSEVYYMGGIPRLMATSSCRIMISLTISMLLKTGHAVQ